MNHIFLLFLIIPSYLFAQWTPVSSLPPNFQTDHSFGFSINNTGYLVSGGRTNLYGNTTYYDKFFSYNPTTDIWTEESIFPGGKRGFAIGDVWDDKAYFGFGIKIDITTGEEVYLNDLWVFDPTTTLWTELSSCPCSARSHPAFVAHNGKIYVGMGSYALGDLNDWWEYDIASDTWTQKNDFPSHERHHPYQFAVGDFVYTGFGHGSIAPDVYDTWYRFDPINNEWIEVQNIPGQARVAGTQFSHNNFGYVLSGDGANHDSMSDGEFWQYNPDTDSWAQFPSHPGGSRWAPASFIIEDEVYIINGSSFGIYQSEVYKYDLNAEPPVGVSNWTQDVEILPNPFQTEINLLFEPSKNTTIHITNAIGKTVYKSTYSEKNIDLSHLEQGVYFIEIQTGAKHILTKKLIKA
ncbi:MAG: Kelch repeat-containing protein [Flavobacteriales bacterium]